MSMFRTMQGAPGVITLFTRPQSRVSDHLFKQLQYYSKPFQSKKNPTLLAKIFGERAPKNGSEEDRYTIDLQNTCPTYDQFLTMTSFLSTHKSNFTSFRHAFPPIGKEMKYVGDLKVPERLEYEAMMSKGVNGEEESFVTPLVVDWNQALIASDDEGIERIIQYYKAQV
ncbi:hypothetical protein BABINDRAFT_163378 [Babjeviella inositovora NRRL Y-12698]|uniref:Uncharacterized protein n=1 Tax=Babjeviella inositovora NRRL Y-12698 TaxID=984486 RepID=A0A1E3QIW7_9ASCO|nr:uncharacterized protein BABINDRAFT_163378 [Babjeviella inositovora NRRL Y-12698]ODQ77663.1 hypothetical protein BABINDRAFT_163378 [Babjeviella inositovora NRRL Y-12698]